MTHDYFISKAIENARKNKHHFGAVIVKNNKIIAYPRKRPVGDPRFHAEMEAIFNACNKLKTRELKSCTLYATTEPCPMCFYMAWITNIPRIVYGASVNDAIKSGSREIRVSASFLNKKGDHKIKIAKGILKKECIKLLNST